MSSVVIKQMLEQEAEDQELFLKFREFIAQLEKEADEGELLQDKKKPVKGCSRGNWRHKTDGTFGSKGMKKGSSSLANDPSYANKKNCRRGRARVDKGQERFISHSQTCGRAGPNKCSEPKPRVKEAIEVPDSDGDGFVSVYEFSKALDKQQRKLEQSQERVRQLQRAVAHLKKTKCDSISAGRLAMMARTMARALKGQEPEKQ